MFDDFLMQVHASHALEHRPCDLGSAVVIFASVLVLAAGILGATEAPRGFGSAIEEVKVAVNESSIGPLDINLVSLQCRRGQRTSGDGLRRCPDETRSVSHIEQ